MAKSDVPDSVRRLITDSIDSVAELEAVLLLRRHSEQEWTAPEAAARLYVSDTVAEYLLDVLRHRGFFTVRQQSYRYAPASPELNAAVALLAVSYSSNLIEVTQLVHTKPSSSVRAFARAFRLRKEP